MIFCGYVSLTLFILTGVHAGIFNAGPYNLKMTRQEPCADHGEISMDLHIVKKSSHKAFLQGYYYIPVDLDDTVDTYMNFSRLGAQGWTKNAYIFKGDKYCSKFQRDYSTLFYFFFKSLGIENPSCLIKAGNYTIDMDTDLPRLPRIPMLPYGTYRISNTMVRGNPPVPFWCSVWYLTCTERPR